MVGVAVRLALIFILAFTGVKIWYNRLEESMLTSVPVEQVAEVQPVEEKMEIRRQADDYGIITERNIFGAALEEIVEEVPEPPPVEEMQPTKLKLSLMGTVSGNERDSRAIIADEVNRKQDIYAVGDTVQGALITAIERQRVVLQVNGRNEVLNLKERKGGPADTPLASTPEQGNQRRTLRERLSVRRPSVRPAPISRPRPVVIQPGESEEIQPEIQDLPEEGIEEFPDQFPEEAPDQFPDQFSDQQMEQPEDFGTMDQEEPGAPDIMDDEQVVEPELMEEDQY
ncbi:MAG: type II secretion system protein N [Desulfobulbaceae bacterium]|nr:type II secretion system protein N [Desulfobulbaceae bacterium]